jgi:hypothetical protein
MEAVDSASTLEVGQSGSLLDPPFPEISATVFSKGYPNGSLDENTPRRPHVGFGTDIVSDIFGKMKLRRPFCQG